MGSRITVFLSDFDMIKQALSRQELTGRPNTFAFQLYMYFQNLGEYFSFFVKNTLFKTVI